MSTPLPPTLHRLNLAQWGEILRLEVEPASTLSDGSIAYPDLTSFEVRLGDGSGTWVYAGSGAETSFSVSTGAASGASDLWVLVQTVHFGEKSLPVVAQVPSFARYATGRTPQGCYLRPAAYPYRGALSSQDLLDDFRAWAATDAAMAAALGATQEAMQDWITQTLDRMASNKQQLRQWNDAR